MGEEIVKVGKWNVPKNLYDEYVKCRIIVDSHTNGKADFAGKGLPNEKYERAMRWQICVQRLMEIHREICSALGVVYSENTDDEFYRAFHKKTEEDSKLKGR